MLATVVVVVATGDLSMGVLSGVVLSGVFFAAKVARLLGIITELSEDGREITYFVTGQVFFASSNSLVDAFDYRDVPERVRIDVSDAHFWDITAIGEGQAEAALAPHLGHDLLNRQVETPSDQRRVNLDGTLGPVDASVDLFAVSVMSALSLAEEFRFVVQLLPLCDLEMPIAASTAAYLEI
jgi:MFS superfamily sulfate permease-like transporter